MLRTREKFERAIRMKRRREENIKFILSVVVVIIILMFALYGAAAAVSNLKLEKKQTNHEKVWTQHVQAGK